MSDLPPASKPAPVVGPDLTITVRAGADPAAPHRGTLSIGDWTVPCAVGRSGIVDPASKREGDAATPAGRFALRYGYYEAGAFADAQMAALDFPFKPKPASYDWIEDPSSPDYNRMRARRDGEAAPDRAAKLFDLFVPLGWNDAVPLAAGGSAIFLHAARPDLSGTAGCVAVPHDELMNLAQRLRPGMIIDIAPAARPTVAASPHASPDASPVASPVAAPHASPDVSPNTLPGTSTHALPDAAAGTSGDARVEMIEAASFHSLRPGPRVILTGAVHGNEVCGPKAIARVIDGFRAGRHHLLCGSVTFVPIVNMLAYRHDRREGDRNLNRALRDYPVPLLNEDHIANVLCRLLRAHDVLIDLHSFSAEGPPFALFGPTAAGTPLEPRVQHETEMRLIRAIGLPFAVQGWMPAHQKVLTRQGRAAEIAHAVGTTEFTRFTGGAAITVECGSHRDPDAVQTAHSVILRGLAALGLLPAPAAAPAASTRILQVDDAIIADSAGDRLQRRFITGERVRKGQVIGRRATGADITAPRDGAIIFASETAAQGAELCFMCSTTA